MAHSPENAIAKKPTKWSNSTSWIQIQIKTKSQFEFEPHDTEKKSES